MSERDAFGREKGEDSLAEMGWSWQTDVPPASTPTPTPAPTSTPAMTSTPLTPEPTFTAAPKPPPAMSAGAGPGWTAPPPAMVRLRRRRRARGIMVPLILIGLVALFVGGATTALQSGSGALDDFQSAIRDATENAAPPSTATPEPPTGLESGSLLRPAALKAAIRKLPSGQITSLRVAPERIDAQVFVDGKMHVVQVRSDGQISNVATPVGGKAERMKVDASAPSRIVRTVAKRSGRSAERVSYLVLLGNEWQLFFDDGLHYSASANGRKVKRVG